MLLGPVCHFELVRIARRSRTFLLRFLLGLLVLAVIGFAFADRWGRLTASDMMYSLDELSRLGKTMSVTIMTIQLVLVLSVTPGLLADAISAERRRKTLHDLLTTRLTGGEIARGKLGARLVELGTFSALLLPIISLLSFFGGVSPIGLAVGYLVLAALAFFLGSLSLLMSVLSRRPRSAVSLSYGLMLCWLVLPAIVDRALVSLGGVVAPAGQSVVAAAFTVNQWIWPARPWGLLDTSPASILAGNLAESWRAAVWAIASPFAFGTLFLSLAGWQLRPAYQRQEGRAGRQTRAVRVLRRWVPVRPCGDQPVFWKEAHFNRAAAGLGGRFQRGVLLTFLGLALAATLYASKGAFLELWNNGYPYVNSSSYEERLTLNLGLRMGGAILFGIWMMSLAGATAEGVASEFEQDTWVALISTPLDRAEILRGKALGPLRSTAPIGAVLVGLWIIGAAAGAVHPLGMVCSVAAGAVLTWFVIALSMYSGYRSKIAWRARAWTQSILAGSHLCCMLPVPSILGMMGLALCSYAELHEVFADRQSERAAAMMAVGYLGGGIFLYGLVAAGLTRAVYRAFDREADRPRRSARALAGYLPENRKPRAKPPADEELG